MAKEDVIIDPMNKSFAKSMEIFTWVGLIIMIAPGIAYFAGVNQFVDMSTAASHWGDSASKFWEETQGITISGYSWFMNNLSYFDMLSVVGVAFIALVPLISIIAAIPRSKGIYTIILVILVIEFIVAIVRPLLMHVTGH